MNTYEGRGYPQVTAQATLTKHRFVDFAGNHAASGEKALGITDEAGAASGDVINLKSGGIFIVEAGGAITQGAKVQSNAAGKAIAYSSGEPNGYAVDAASADGDYIRVQFY